MKSNAGILFWKLSFLRKQNSILETWKLRLLENSFLSFYADGIISFVYR